MKKIFKKLLLTYLSVVALALFFLSLLLFQLFQAHLFQEKQASLLETARYINSLLTEHHRGDLGEDELRKAVNLIGETTNSRILILDGIDPAGGSSPAGSIPGFEEEGISGSLEQILRGETLLQRRLYSRELGVHVVAVGLPVKGSLQRVRGAVILFSPVYPIEQALQRAKGIMAFTASATLLLGTFLIYFIARKMSDPIVNVSRSAMALARGEKPPDLPPGPRDEVGQLIQSFNYMKNQLGRMEKLRREFLTSISHELRTPLTAIRGFVQGIVDGVIPPGEEDKYLKLTLAETSRLSGLIDDLLEVGRLESGSVTLRCCPVNLSDLVRQVMALITGQAAGKKVELSLEAPAEVYLWADSDRLKQVIWNLMANALAFTPSGGSIRIAIRETRHEVHLTVEDTGIGIPKDDLPHIFSLFYRVDAPRDPSSGGTGLGLTIVKNIVELHRGSIRAESAPGKGTRMTIHLPKGNSLPSS